jgi:FKBP-type peptidyl-prolyl cis-trans isomerase FkpA
MIESLESRQLRSVSTTTTFTPSVKTVEFGTTVDISVKVTAAKGKVAPRGNVRLYLGTSASVWNANLSSKGIATIAIDPGLAIYPGSYTLKVRYNSTNGFSPSSSKTAPLTVSFPKGLTTLSNGLKIKTLTAGTGAAVEQGDSVTVKESAYNNAGQLLGASLELKPPALTFTVEANPEQVITGFDEGVVGMRMGEVRDLEIPASLNSNTNASVLFVVELVSIDT